MSNTLTSCNIILAKAAEAQSLTGQFDEILSILTRFGARFLPSRGPVEPNSSSRLFLAQDFLGSWHHYGMVNFR